MRERVLAPNGSSGGAQDPFGGAALRTGASSARIAQWTARIGGDRDTRAILVQSDNSRRYDACAERGRSHREGQDNRTQVEGRHFLTDRRNGRPFEGRARCRAWDHGGCRYRTSILRGTRHRVERRPGQRRRDRSGNHQDKDRGPWPEAHGRLPSATSLVCVSRKLPCVRPF